MSNRRRPERRDAHGAPVRSRHEILVAAGVVVGVLALTVALLLIFQHRTPSNSVVTPPSSVASNSTTSTTTPATSASSEATSSTSAATSSTSTASSSTTTTTP
jgi:cytoskeletal protein RodZ